MKINKYDITLAELEGLAKLVGSLRELVYANPLIKEIDRDAAIRFEAVEAGKFFFEVSNSRFLKDELQFLVTFVPKGPRDKGQHQTWYNFDQCLHSIRGWIKFIQRYHDTNIPDPPLDKEQEEIFDNIRIHDKDADHTYFNLEQQVYLLNFIAQAKTELSQHKEEGVKQEEIKPLVDDFDKLATELPSLTKNGFMRRLSRIFARVQRVSLRLFKKILTAFEVLIIEKGLEKGGEFVIENWREYVDKTLELLRLLPP